MLELKQIGVSLSGRPVLRDLNLQVEDGEFLSILGTSGCGKSTLLKTVCGFTEHQTGEILVDGVCVDRVPIHKRNMVLVFQDLRLFPNMNVWENVAFPLKMQGIKKPERKEKAIALLSQAGLAGLEDRRVGEISGGQQQRVALARAYAAAPKILLMDEPFSGLDEETRGDMQTVLKALHQKHRISILFVTHQKDEAALLSDRVVMLEDLQAK